MKIPKHGRRGLMGGVALILFLSFVVTLFNNYGNSGFAQSKCSATSKSARWINIERANKSDGYSIRDLDQNKAILTLVPRLVDAITIADVVHERLKPFNNSLTTTITVSPTNNVNITDKDTSVLLDSIPFNRSSSVDREGRTINDFKAYLSHKDKVYLVHIFEIKCPD